MILFKNMENSIDWSNFPKMDRIYLWFMDGPYPTMFNSLKKSTATNTFQTISTPTKPGHKPFLMLDNKIVRT